ncbi:MAG: hypothetical protein OXH20_00435, partial [bacterium]|nr:hypothetical protein [bacterium]
PWDKRFKGVVPLPGGYDGQLTWLEGVCRYIQDDRPQRNRLLDWLESTFSLTSKAADSRVSFLLKVGLLEMERGVCGVSVPTQRWLDSGDATVLIAQMHSRTQFIGEMLHEVKIAHDTQNALRKRDLLAVANERYWFGWTTTAQIDFRRGWLQSAKLIIANSEKRFEITQLGHALLDRLTLHEPPPARASTDVNQERPRPPRVPDPPTPPESRQHPSPGANGGVGLQDATSDSPATALADELRASSVDSADHARFEAAVRDAFEFLGFRAEQLGGSGKTDVLLDAPRGKNHSYRVTVDAKSVGASGAARGQLKDHQVDWLTLQEHRRRHRADYSLLIGPEPAGGRIFSRAQESDVAIMSSDELAQLCLRHEQLPLGLGDYESLFTSSGRVNISRIEERFKEAVRSRDLAYAACRSLINKCGIAGPMSAKDLWWVLLEANHPENAWEIDEIQDVLLILSSDLVGAVEAVPDAEGGPDTYIPATSLDVVQLRLGKLAEAVGSSESET